MRVFLDTVRDLVKTRDELCVMEDKLAYLRGNVDNAINLIMDYLKFHNYIDESNPYQYAYASSGEDMERSMVDDLCEEGEDGFGEPSDDENWPAL